MIKLAKDLSRNQRRKKLKEVRGVYFDDDDDLFDVYLVRYPNSVVTLKSALSIYNITDEWNNPPFDLVFQEGYRTIRDNRIKQFREDKKLLYLGAIKKNKNGIVFNIYNYERLLIEIFRKEKYLPKDIYKQAIVFYRDFVVSGKFNIPLFKEYLSKIPKSKMYQEKFFKEVI